MTTNQKCPIDLTDQTKKDKGVGQRTHPTIFFSKAGLALMVCIDKVPSFFINKKIPFSYPMQIWQPFIILRQPVDISVTVFPNLTKLTNNFDISFILTILMQHRNKRH